MYFAEFNVTKSFKFMWFISILILQSIIRYSCHHSFIPSNSQCFSCTNVESLVDWWGGYIGNSIFTIIYTLFMLYHIYKWCKNWVIDRLATWEIGGLGTLDSEIWWIGCIRIAIIAQNWKHQIALFDVAKIRWFLRSIRQSLYQIGILFWKRW